VKGKSDLREGRGYFQLRKYFTSNPRKQIQKKAEFDIKIDPHGAEKAVEIFRSGELG
jgi:hypothetical protein